MLNLPNTANAFIQSLAARLPEPRFGEERMDYVRRLTDELDDKTPLRNVAEAALLRWHNEEVKTLIRKLEQGTDIESIRETCLFILKQQVVA